MSLGYLANRLLDRENPRMRVDTRTRYSPSDLTAFVACPHLTTLELRVARAELERPFRVNRHADLIRAKGEQHEAAQLALLGPEVVKIEKPWEIGWEEAAAATEQAMADEAPYIYQAAFVDGDWRGLADFLERQPDGDYEALDTKLARHARPGHVLQLAFYSEQISRLQGRMPAAMHVINGLGERESFRLDDYLAYYRRLKRRFCDVVANGNSTYPYPVDHCGLCDFLRLCQQQWAEDDHLVQVAGMSRLQVERLTAGGIETLEALGVAPPQTRIAKIRPQSFETVRHQAELQLHHRSTGSHRVDPLPLEPDRGFALLPEPSPGDIWLDLEGHPWFEPARGLEYLFGWAELDEHGQAQYECLWARDRDEERACFERLIDRIAERRARYPGMHVYHYAPYERTALGRLMGEHGTREDDFDELLRGGVLVDLYRVMRQALIASVESYSIKRVEELYGFERTAEVSGGSESVVNFEQWLETGEQSLLDEIAAYNQEDCLSLYELHRWLLEQRPPEGEWRPPPIGRGEPSEQAQEHLQERERVRSELLDGASEGEPRWLLAQLLEYHHRESRPQWWEYYHHLSLDEQELLEDGDTIGGLELVGEPVEVKQSLEHTFKFPPQEHKISGIGVDQATEREYGRVSVDDEQGTLTILRGKSLADEPLPKALIPPTPLPTWVQRDAVLRFATNRENHSALVEILERRPPRAALSGSLADAALSLDGSYLFVQGPPGSGKTWNGARMAIALMRAGRRVGITALSHKAIHKFLEDVEDAAVEAGYSFEGRKKCSRGDSEYQSRHNLVRNAWSYDELDEEGVQLVAGTSFVFSREDQDVDTLFIDEGGQFALADALAVGTSARNLILLGDPNQLPQVSQGSHPPGANASVLSHLLGEDETVRPEMGVFLEQTWRMRPEVNDYISQTFYEGRLEPAEVCSERSVDDGNGIRLLVVEHSGHSQASPEEAEVIAEEITRLLGTPYRDEDGERLLQPDDFVIVSPYNAHVRCLRQQIPDQQIRIGTVDKFQGQQAPVVFYSMASSSADDVPRGLEFLFSRNRLNVAISRAKCLAHLVCSPRLLDANCRTIEQMRLANALCLLVEFAGIPKG